ncbi:uncharacterized protein LOC133531880 isoform X1 [Cydia pomonella]|uniref:uncharacterized protein LOC133531880 isoform X1 n=1 Tax=Cydia pomonella TaxID=82600 RepID=UPI002ADE40C0|nr:uncharacterized protein LOC133531880 isoform X1 [Cydia pomonella]
MSGSNESSLLVETNHNEDSSPSSPEIEKNITEKSMKIYKRCYTNFMEWRKKENISTISQKVLLAYFQDMSTKYAPSTLWAEYSMIKSTLKLYEKTDISCYGKLQQFLKQKSEGYKVKKSKTFSPSDIDKFIRKAPDEVYLMLKVAVIFGVLGACRRQELHRLLFKDIKMFNEALLVNIKKTKNKLDRTFTITGKYYDIVKKFIGTRPKDCRNEHFFLKYFKGKCSQQNVGINAFGNMGKQVATYLKLSDPELYTGMCFRRTSATLICDAGGDIAALKKPSLRKEWTSVVTDYIDHSIQNKQQPSRKPKKPRIAYSSESSDSDSSTRTQPEPSPSGPNRGKQCRFCGDFKECSPVVQKPYLMGNKTSLALNHLRVELDFSIDSLPKTICRDCDAKLLETFEFIKQVNTAQFSLVAVCPNNATNANNSVNSRNNKFQHIEIDTQIVKAEFESTDEDSDESKVEIRQDALTLGETIYLRETHKRKHGVDDKKMKKVKKGKRVKSLSTELIIDIKQERMENEDKNSEDSVDFSDTGTEVKPSELELAESSLDYQKGKQTFSDTRVKGKKSSEECND